VSVRQLVTLPLETFTEDECPFCRQGIPVNTELGKGRAFLRNRTA
jgi:orotate phosphoribosyltransferase